MQWAKKNLLVLIPIVVALIGVPVMVFFSMGMTTKLKSGVEADLNRALNDLRGFDVVYRVPAVEPGAPDFESSQRPNEAMTSRIRSLRTEVRDQALQVREAAVERNSRGKRLLIDGETASEQLFPQPLNDSTRIRLTQRFIEAWSSAHDQLLETYGFKMPPPSSELIESLRLTRDREAERIRRGRLNPELDAEDQKAIRAVLLAQRLGTYRARANETRIYGSRRMFVELGRWLPWTSQTQLPPLEQMWDWQEIYWIHEDIVKGLASANTGSTGSPTTVVDGPVKRVLSIEVMAWAPERRAGGRGGDQDAVMPSGPGPDGSASIEPDFTWAHTGRFGFPNKPNALYDVRYATIEIIADALRLPEIIDSLNRTNFMTVLEQKTSVIPPGSDLSYGFDYGSTNLVQATLRVEVVYFRDWRAPAMPEEIRKRLGIATTTGADGSGSGNVPDDPGGDRW